MKKYLILLLFAAVCGPLSAQTKHEVHDFYSLMTAVSIDEYFSVKQLKKTDSMVVVEKYPLKNISEFYLKLTEKIGPDIDKLGIIDYNSDTVFVFDWWDTFSNYIIVATKSNAIAFDLDTNLLEFSKVEFPKYVDLYEFVRGNYLLKKVFFEILADWSENKFIELNKKYGVSFVSPPSPQTLARLVVKDNVIIRKDLYYYNLLYIEFDDVFKYWETNILPNKEQ